MTLFQWEQIYSVGHPEIDAQHRQLFDIANRFHAACEAGATRTELAERFGELLRYTAFHFAAEEALLLQANYPDFARHKANHDKLVDLVGYYRQQFQTEAADVEQRAMEFIKTWLNGHILGTDRAYRAFVAPAGA